ncbi:MAG: hypothetical protein AAF598_14720, partial [Bacteroidota bacterium]
MRGLFVILFAFVLAGCRTESGPSVIPVDNAVIGLNSPIPIGIEKTTTLLMKDFFIDPQVIDSVYSPHYATKLAEDKSALRLLTTEFGNIPYFSWLTVYAGGYPYAFLIQKRIKN